MQYWIYKFWWLKNLFWVSRRCSWDVLQGILIPAKIFQILDLLFLTIFFKLLPRIIKLPKISSPHRAFRVYFLRPCSILQNHKFASIVCWRWSEVPFVFCFCCQPVFSVCSFAGKRHCSCSYHDNCRARAGYWLQQAIYGLQHGSDHAETGRSTHQHICFSSAF